jgi:hypothetical protein
MLLIEKILKKYSTESDLKELQTKLFSKRLIFGNKLSISKKLIYDTINYILDDTEGFIECSICGGKFSLAGINVINEMNICESCMENDFISCDCGKLVHIDNVHIFNNTGYCKECYFLEKQEAYNSHKIQNPLIKKLIELPESDYNIFNLEFHIDKHIFTIDKYSGNNYRLGSFGGNQWIDIGNIEGNLLQAIDFNLGDNTAKLTRIIVSDNVDIDYINNIAVLFKK